MPRARKHQEIPSPTQHYSFGYIIILSLFFSFAVDWIKKTTVPIKKNQVSVVLVYSKYNFGCDWSGYWSEQDGMDNLPLVFLQHLRPFMEQIISPYYHLWIFSPTEASNPPLQCSSAPSAREAYEPLPLAAVKSRLWKLLGVLKLLQFFYFTDN